MPNKMEIIGLPAFRDNYIWLLLRGDHAVVVDPGDAAPVSRFLAQSGVSLAAILLTHHHADHTGGVADLLAQRSVPVYGPASEAIAEVTAPLREGDRVDLPELDVALQTIEVPGHTRGHIAYYGANTLLCGDTLFACGCGRLFEGSPEQMWQSLSKLAALPADTQVYCAHEYTQANIAFALAVEPGNTALQARAARVDALRAELKPTVPSTLGEERATNPFLRCREPAVILAAEKQCGTTLNGASAVFTALRSWKNNF